MKIIIYSTKNYEKDYLEQVNQRQHELHYLKEGLFLVTVDKAKNFIGICCFVTDHLDRHAINKLDDYGVRLIVLRSAGYDHRDI